MKKIPKSYLQKRVQIIWDDPTGHIGSELSEVGLAECISEGILVAMDDEKLILQTSIYTGSKCGDYTCIHIGLVKNCLLLEPSGIKRSGKK